ncbi:hypothetical protein K438DRAFT_1777341 [Mycena galopus ATCC 62051]|nr:hypothetical protein K438DRAFT_1777341 [Mycena galopus ATCC 62051]
MSSSQRSLFYRPYLPPPSTQTTFVIGSSHPLSHWITARPLPANPALFDGPEAEAQRATTELLLYSTTLSDSGQVSWPVVGDHTVPPLHLAKYLQQENLYWPCFCVKGSDSKLSCRIITWYRDVTVAVCHHDQPRCQFFLNLSSIFKTCTSKEVYVPLGPSDLLLARRMLSEKPGDLNPAKNWLAGYLGEAGVSQIEVFTVATPELFFPKYLTQGGFAFQPPFFLLNLVFQAVSDVDGLDENEVKVLKQLANGRGMDHATIQHLIGCCSQCNHHFLAHFLCDHRASCQK